jgi:hypothetical protein
VSDWVRQLFVAHGERVVVKVIDAASLEGLAKVVRYRVRRLPAVIVARETRFAGEVHAALDAARQDVDRRLAERQPAGA